MHAFLLLGLFFSMANGQAPTIESDGTKVVVKVANRAAKEIFYYGDFSLDPQIDASLLG